MIPLEDAQARVLALGRRLDTTEAPLAGAVGCVTAEAVRAGADQAIPPFANSAMDGYAVRAADTAAAPVTLAVAGTLHAGAAWDGPPLRAGQAVGIMTGAPLPPGADAVVMVERTRRDGDRVVIEATAGPGDHVRPPGDDIAAGAEVVAAGTVLRPAHLGVIASLGRDTVTVVRRARVGVLSTGDELVPPGQPLGPGQIHDTNRPVLLALVADAAAMPVDLGHAGDSRDVIVAALDDAAGRSDLVLTTGGVSMGEADHLKALLGEAVQVAIKPAKPLAFGTVGTTPVIGLPGNPVSAVVSFELFARPLVRRLMGHPDDGLHRPRIRGRAAAALRRRPDGKVHFVRVVTTVAADGVLEVAPVGGQGSHQLWAAARADALAVVPDGDGVGAGAAVELVPLP